MNGICRSAFASFGPDLGDGAAELAGGLVDAGLRGGEVLVDDVLRQVADLDRAAGGGGCGRRRRRLTRALRRGGDRGGRRRRGDGRSRGRAPAAGAGRERDRRAPDEGERRPADVCFKCDSSYCSRRLLAHPRCDRGRRRWPTSADAVDGRLGLVGEGRDDDREDQQQPEGDALDLDRHAGEPQRVLHDRDHEHGEHDARDRAPPAEDVDAAQEHDRDHGQGHPLPGVGPGAREARCEDHAGQRRDDPGEHEQAQCAAAGRGRRRSARRRCSCRWHRPGARSMSGGGRCRG